MSSSEQRLPPAQVPEIDMPYDCDVYEPAEDTFLFLDALQDELQFLMALDPTVCLEIGCAPPSQPTSLMRPCSEASTCG